MRFISKHFLTGLDPARLRVWLAAFDEGFTLVMSNLVWTALALLLFTGELIDRLNWGDSPASLPFFHGLHILLGWSLLLGLGYFGLLLTVRGFIALRRKQGVPWRIQALISTGVQSRAFWLWLVLGVLLTLMVVSGLERAAHLRMGSSLAPWAPPSAWWMLHRAVSPFLYALLLYMALKRGKILFRKWIAYLNTP